ncbi:hypothetical protein ERX46_16525 [Brumimicrobium glaciale]|uniref:HEAT repeat domain-containing protein n=1 Tax=Brumimicrobium glaciale TaxID=200475 RepID=A0A4Q4KE10_9FLAO|nr:hypothetical protein [Brumimicrobium glaciale]RYM31292.1 hypothetical protein ERX46_16525 [Brumimicrobium glaciale]
MQTSETPLESILTKSYKEEMISYITAHQDEVDELIELAVSDKQPYSWRAAWLLWIIMEKNDLRVQAHVSTMVKQLNSCKDGQQRNLINILLKMEVPEENEGLLFDSCVDIWLKIEKQSSVRYKAFEVIVQLAKKYPELNNEVESLTDKRFIEPLSGGIRRSFYNLIKQ